MYKAGPCRRPRESDSPREGVVDSSKLPKPQGVHAAGSGLGIRPGLAGSRLLGSQKWIAGGSDQPAASQAALYRATRRRRWIRRRSKPACCKPGSAFGATGRGRGREVGLHKWAGPSGKSSRLTLMGGKASCPGHPTCTGPDQAGPLKLCPGEAPPRRGSVQSLPHSGPPTPTTAPNLPDPAWRL